jgi:hypothetical protein
MDTDHCTGVDTDTYVHSLLAATVSLRGVCKRGVLSPGKTKKDVWVPNVFGKMIPACNGAKEQAIGWKEIAAADGVHLVESGYAKMAAGLKDCICELLKRTHAPAPHSVSAKAGKNTYYWRGFLSVPGRKCKAQEQPRGLHANSSRWRRQDAGLSRQMGQARDNRSRPPYYRKN